MSPILLNANENKFIDVDISDDAYTTPDVELEKTPMSASPNSNLMDVTPDPNNALENASSLVKSKSSNDTRPMDVIKAPKLPSRGRSYSDPTKKNIKITIDQEDDEKYPSSKDSSLALDMGGCSAQSAPGPMDVTSEKCVPPYNHKKMKSSSYDPFYTLPPRAQSAYSLRANNRRTDDVLLSVLVSHGFCSRSSLNSAKHLKSYIQG